MIIKVEFDVDADLIECPDHISGRLSFYQEEFLKWLTDKKNDHKYWAYVNDQKIGCDFRSEAFVDWLNQFVFDGQVENAKVIKKFVKRIEKAEITLFF